MVSKNNFKHKMEADARRVPHFGLRKLSVGVASVLLSTTLYFGMTAHADTNVPVENQDNQPKVSETTNTANEATSSKQVVLHNQADSQNSASQNQSAIPINKEGTQVKNVSQVASNENETEETPVVNAQSDNSLGVNSQKQEVRVSAVSQESNDSSSEVDASVRNVRVQTYQKLKTNQFLFNNVNALVLSAVQATPAVAGSNVAYQAGTAGVNDQFNRYVTRTINYTLPGQATQTKTQTVHFVRQDTNGNAGVTQADGTIKYVGWTVADINNKTTSAVSGTFGAFDLPQVLGYVPADTLGSSEVDGVNNKVVEQVVLPSMVNQTVNVIYNQIGLNKPIHVVDDTTGEVIADWSVTGNAGDKRTINAILPDGYQLVTGQNVPTSITLDPKDLDTVIYHAKEIEVTVTPDSPKTTADIVPGTQSVHYVSGLDQASLNRTVTRTVTINVPGKNPQTKVDTVTFTRSATFNAVTGAVIYTPWSENGTHTFSAITADPIDGYEVQRDADTGNVVVTPDSQDFAGTVNYVPISDSIEVDFVGEDQTLGSFQIDGNTGDTYDYSYKDLQNELINAGLDSYFTIPLNTTLSGTIRPGQTLSINVQPITYTYNSSNIPASLPDDSDIPDGVTADNLQHVISRKVTINPPAGHGSSNTIMQSTTFNRTATVDMGKIWSGDDSSVTLSDWTTVNNTLASVDVPTIAGYTPSGRVDSVTVNADSKPADVVINYTANNQTGTIVYQDVDNNSIEVGHTDLSGVTDATVAINPVAPAGYDIVAGQSIPANETATANGIANVVVKVQHHHITVTPGQESKPGDKISGNTNKKPGDGTPKTDVSYETLHKTLNRTINVTDPHTGAHQTKLTINYERTATIDDVTGNVTYGDWVVSAGSLAGFNKFNIPVVPGYTSQITTGTADELNAFIPDQNAINNWTDQTVDISYTANDQTMHITYVDEDDNPVKGGSFTVTGKTDQQVNTNAKIPTGWVLAQGQSDAPATVEFSGTPLSDITVTVVHGTTNVSHTNPVSSNDKTSTGKVINGAHDADLNQAIVRTITVHEPGKAATTITQTAKIFRDATVDNVTGAVTYGAWSTDPTDWVAYDAPVHAGYTVSQSHVDSVIVANGQQNVPIDITYKANTQTGKIIYQDTNNNNVVVGHTDLSGVTDATVVINPVAPSGYDIVAGQSIPINETATANGIPDVTVKVKHHLITVTPGQESTPGDKVPANINKKPGDGTPNADITYDTLHRNMTRTINVKDPHNGTKTTTVTLHYERTATIDDVTGNVTYSNWTVATSSKVGFDAFTIPSVPGYTSKFDEGTADELTAMTPTQDQVTNWTDQTVNISYTANDQTMHITYVDNSGHPVDGGSFTVTGKTDQTVATNAKIPAGWVLEQGQSDAPVSVTFGGTPTADITIKIQHGTQAVSHDNPLKPGTKTPSGKDITGVSQNDLNKTVTRTIKVTTPDSKTSTTIQTGTIFRDATVDTVTGAVTYTDWSKATLADFKPNAIAGYTVSQSDVPAVAVTPDGSDSTVTITYTANPQHSSVNYVVNGILIKSTALDGKTDQTINVTYAIPDGYELVAGQSLPNSYTFKADSNMPILVQLVKKQQLTVTYVGLDGEMIGNSLTVNGVTGQSVKVPTDEMPAGYQLVDGQSVPATFTLNDKDDNDLTIVIKPMVVIVNANAPVVAGSAIPGAHGAVFPAGLTDNNLTKTIMRTINIANPDGTMHTVGQSVSFNRSAAVNAVTGAITYGNWTANGSTEMPAYNPVVRDGFVADTAKGQVVTPDTPDSTIKLVYHQVPQAKAPLYIDATGKGYDALPDGYIVVPGQSSAKGSQLIVPDVKPVTPKVEFVTRTVTMIMPNGHQRTIKQRVRKDTNFGRVAVPKLHGYKMNITGDNHNLGVMKAVSDLNIVITFTKA